MTWSSGLSLFRFQRQSPPSKLGHFRTLVWHEGFLVPPEGFAHRLREGRVPMTDFFPERKRPEDEWEITPF